MTELYGIRNGHIVDTHLLRGGEVSKGGIGTLVDHNVKQVICVRGKDSEFDPAVEQRLVEAVGMVFTHKPLYGHGWFSYDDIKLVPAILEIIEISDGKVFVHCRKGSDRTGVVIACYRVDKGWSAARAIKEMKKYGNAWYNHGMRKAVENYKRREL